ncbi:hypothetical protein QYE76_043716 [Lolium multiflorum]|uniref:Reverse transcriptase zinc-binding domain-containing protein n=1 Tax=Lolium multiflorum TaxID=4521 RepID=A0AAD8TJL2_LOLMU|nr:hypothetical protein QYE76_043716 [Lolium multiflorum]
MSAMSLVKAPIGQGLRPAGHNPRRGGGVVRSSLQGAVVASRAEWLASCAVLSSKVAALVSHSTNGHVAVAAAANGALLDLVPVRRAPAASIQNSVGNRGSDRRSIQIRFRSKVRGGTRSAVVQPMVIYHGAGKENPITAVSPRQRQPNHTPARARVLDGEPGEWHLQFRRQFGPAEAVEWDNLCHEIQALPTDMEEDMVSWALERSDNFSTKSAYAQLSQGAAVTSFRDVRRTTVPPKIKVFLWQLIRRRLPSGEQFAKRQGASNSLCSLCSDWEDCNHIFFSCSITRLMWAGVRKLLSCDWNPTGAGEFIVITRGLSGPLRRLVWQPNVEPFEMCAIS